MLKISIQRWSVVFSVFLLSQQNVSACDWVGTPNGKELYDLLQGYTGTKHDIFEGYQEIYTPLYGVFLDRLACETGYVWDHNSGSIKLIYSCFYDSQNPYKNYPEVPIDQTNPIAIPPDGSGDCGPGSSIGSSGQKSSSAEFTFMAEEGIDGWLQMPGTVSNAASSGLMF